MSLASLTVEDLINDIHWHPAAIDIPPPKLYIIGWNGGEVFKCRWSETKQCFINPKGKKVNVWMWKMSQK